MALAAVHSKVVDLLLLIHCSLLLGPLFVCAGFCVWSFTQFCNAVLKTIIVSFVLLQSSC